jgi:hypothetical protein
MILHDGGPDGTIILASGEPPPRRTALAARPTLDYNHRRNHSPGFDGAIAASRPPRVTRPP